MPNQEKRTRQTEKEELNTKDTAEEIETKDSGTAAQEKDSGTIVKEGNEEEDTGKDSSDGPDTPSEDAVTSIPEEVELPDSPGSQIWSGPYLCMYLHRCFLIRHSRPI